MSAVAGKEAIYQAPAEHGRSFLGKYERRPLVVVGGRFCDERHWFTFDRAPAWQRAFLPEQSFFLESFDRFSCKGLRCYCDSSPSQVVAFKREIARFPR